MQNNQIYSDDYTFHQIGTNLIPKEPKGHFALNLEVFGLPWNRFKILEERKSKRPEKMTKLTTATLTEFTSDGEYEEEEIPTLI